MAGAALRGDGGGVTGVNAIDPLSFMGVDRTASATPFTNQIPHVGNHTGIANHRGSQVRFRQATFFHVEDRHVFATAVLPNVHDTILVQMAWKLFPLGRITIHILVEDFCAMNGCKIEVYHFSHPNHVEEFPAAT